MPKLALFQPDIAGNVGAIMRLCACLNAELHIIEPCGFPWQARKIRQSAMDYYDHITLLRHDSWDAFCDAHQGSRMILMTTKSAAPYTQFTFQDDDILIAGSESAGVPDFVHEACDHRVVIPMHNNLRSLNLATSCAMVLGEVVRQIGV